MNGPLHSIDNFLLTPLKISLTQEESVQFHVETNEVKISISEQKPKCYLDQEAVTNKDNHERTKLWIKNMVSIRCKMVVKSVLKNLGLNYSTLKLGEVEIIGNLLDANRKQLKSDLSPYGLELLENRKIILVERIKNVIIEMIHFEDELPKVKFSVYLRHKLNHQYSYTYLSMLFAEVTCNTIEHFIIKHKIERAKEMIVYNDELTLSEIAWKLHYKSLSHLSTQFKQISGMTPSHFKTMKHKTLTPLENL